MTEVDKILVAAACAFVGGFLLEPLKLWLTNGVEKVSVRRLCYRQVFLISNSLRIALGALNSPKERFASFSTGEDFARTLIPSLNLGVLQFLLSKKADVVFQLDIGRLSSQIVHTLEGVRGETRIAELRATAESIVGAVDYAVEDWQISGAKLTRLKHQFDWENRWKLISDRKQANELGFGYKVKGRLRFRPIIARSILRWRRIKQILSAKNE